MGKRLRNIVLTFIPCFVFWLLLTMSVEVKELIYGVIVCGIAAWFSSGFFMESEKEATRMMHPWRIVKLVFYLVFVLGWEILKANWAMTVLLNKTVRQAVVRVKVKGLEEDNALALLADSITLTPGTITLDVADEPEGGCCMYVQWLTMDTEDNEAAGEAIKGRMEKWIRRVWK